MNTIDTTANLTATNAMTPALTRTIGGKTFEVFVHFSETSKETLTDKIMRLISNEINSTNLS